MSADTGPRKRFKDKKRRKGSAEISAPGPIIVPKDAHTVKLMSDENMHVHKETNFGGNIVSKLIFFVILLIIGGILFFSPVNKGSIEGYEGKNETSWLPDYFNFASLFSADEPPEIPVEVNDEEEISDTKLEVSFVESLWYLLPFFRETKTDYDEEENTDRSSDFESDNFKDDPNNSERDEDDEGYLPDEENKSDEDKFENDAFDGNNADYDDESDEEGNDDTEQDEEDNIKEVLDNRKYTDQNSDDYDDDSDDEENDNKKLDDEDDDDDDDLSYNEDKKSHIAHNYFKSEENLDSNDDTDDEDFQSYGENGHNSNFDSEILEQSDPDTPEESSNDEETDTTADNEQTATNEILVPPIVEDEEYEFPNDVENDNVTGQSQNTYNSDKLTDEELYQNLQNSESPYEYADTPESESEDASDSVMQWSTSNSADILAHEISESTASESPDNSDVEAEAFQNQYIFEDYNKANITNTYDWRLKDELDQADQDFDNRRFIDSLKRYQRILQTYPHSARAKFGIAKSLDAQAELQQSNKGLANAIEAYVDALLAPDVPDSLFKAAGERVINRMRFKGEYESCISIQHLLIKRFPNSVSYQNELVISLLMLNRIREAKQQLEEILLLWPDNGIALVHYGFVLKLEENLPAAVLYLSKGIQTNETGTQDGRFYFHLGDALQRLGRNEEAMQIYREGVEKGIFLSEYQRSLYNVKRLTSRPWWTLKQTTYESFFSKLKKNWEIIRDEGVSLLKLQNGSFTDESEQLREKGDWKQLELFSRGLKQPQCQKAPITCGLISEFEPAAGCRRGQVKFSVMEPGTHVWPHCGPTNCRLRAHLGLVIPSNVTIRVATETKQWTEGEIFVFDDSFEHEVWHNGSSWRLILIIDVWHPELTMRERRTLAAI